MVFDNVWVLLQSDHTIARLKEETHVQILKQVYFKLFWIV